MKKESHSLKCLFSTLILSAVLMPFAVFAQNQYWYDSINYVIEVRKDTTVLVREEQVIHFVGEYHNGWRSIPYKDISSITDIKVYDGKTGQALEYSPNKLDKFNPSSWDKYTYFYSGGTMNIEWYYDAQDEVRPWIIEYVVHGVLSFLDDKDEFYWNLFTDYSVPIISVSALVSIPQNDFNKSDLSTAIYTSQSSYETAEILDNRNFSFNTETVMAGDGVTIAVGWPKGLIKQSSFWKDWFLINYVWFVSIAVILLTIIVGVFYWYFTEKKNKGRGTVVPQYEPPQKLPPAMAEVIVKETATNKVWAATVVDLAVRGYLKIVEEEQLKIWKFLNALIPKSYIIERIKGPDDKLHDYEKKFMDLLGSRFSTKEMKRSPVKSRELHREMMKLKQELFKETETDTGAYEKNLSREKIRNIIFTVGIFVIFGGFVFLGGTGFFDGVAAISAVFVVCTVALYFFIRFEARLTPEGAVLREDWLGFKMYLETAEKYRLQNLTPETFEKYLPYAIIFGVEKKWGRAFDPINMPPPSWYSSTSFTTSTGSFSPGGFSASAFSASFSSSFVSAFSSAGGGGASGGGGGAGGGGGGAG